MENIKAIKYTGASIAVALILQINVAQAEIKNLVDDLILQHGKMLGAIANGTAIKERAVKIGRAEAVKGHMGLMHAQEIANIINDGGERRLD